MLAAPFAVVGVKLVPPTEAQNIAVLRELPDVRSFYSWYDAKSGLETPFSILDTMPIMPTYRTLIRDIRDPDLEGE